jgi:hypothetical protein
MRIMTKTAAMAGQSMSTVVAWGAWDSCWRFIAIVELDNMTAVVNELEPFKGKSKGVVQDLSKWIVPGWRIKAQLYILGCRWP